MGNKIGRNDACPCGSKKKFKKCCLGKISNKKPTQEQKHPLSIFNIHFLIDVLSSCFLLPSNHGKNIRLEMLIRESLIYGQKDGGSSNIPELQKVLDKHYDSHPYEDPPVNPFTNLITFYGGDYLILPGISEGGDYILTNILNAIFHLESTLSTKLKEQIRNLTLVILNISHRAIQNVGLYRYFEAIIDDNRISLFHQSEASRYIASIGITNEDLERLLNKYEIKDENILEPFLLDINVDNLGEEDPHINPIIPKPILKTEGGYKVLSYSNLHIALLHQIIKLAKAENCLEQLIKLQTSLVWNDTNVYLGHLGYEPLSNYTPRDTSKLAVFEYFYEFDMNKIAYLTLQYDNGANYDLTHPFATMGKMSDVERIEDHIESIVNNLQTEFPEKKILIIHSFVGIGRSYSRSYRKFDDVEVIAFPAYHFNLINRTRDYETLNFWNYALARRKLESQLILPLLNDEIDTYTTYKNLDDSFYLNDNVRPNFLLLEIGNAKKFISELLQNEDRHSILKIDTKGYYKVVCIKDKQHENLYYSLNDIGRVLTKAVTGYKMPIWIEYPLDLMPMPDELRGICFQFLDAFCYWIWQVTSFLSPTLNGLEIMSLKMTFHFIDETKFCDIDLNQNREDTVENDFEIKIFKNIISIAIPPTLLPYLYGEDNTGEQILVRKILEGFDLLLKKEAVESVLTSSLIDEIIEQVVAIEYKKKVFIYNTENNLKIDPRDIGKVRYIQDYNVNKHLDLIVPKLLEHKIIDENTTVIEEKGDFIRSMSSKILLPDLTAVLAPFDTVYLLKHFFASNEALIREREKHIFDTPSRIACFVSKEKQTEILNKEFQKIDRTSLSTRCLIEFLSACPGKGIQIASQEDIDDILVFMDQTINWGMIGDQVTYDLAEIEIEILKSGRIGKDSKMFDEVFLPFSLSKSNENVADSFNRYKSNYKDSQKSDNKEAFSTTEEEAFLEEYGFTLTELINFLYGLSHISFMTNSACTILSEDELKLEIFELLPDFTNKTIDALLIQLSLKKRKHIMDIPEGMEAFDIYPWRYNRRLSLNFKPLVLVSKAKERSYYFGARQLLKSMEFIIYLFYSGKLRTKPEGKLNKLIGKNLSQKGSDFTNEVFTYLQTHIDDVILDIETQINPNVFFKHTKDIGDIDILLINKQSKKIYLIECKNTEVAKNMKQLVVEVDHLFGTNSEKGWLKKHQERYEWVIENIELLENKYNTLLTDFEIIPVILTSEQLATEYLKKDEMPFKMTNFYTLKESLLNAFE